jgi:predicted dehydrogenase
MTSAIRVAVIGVGAMGRNHARVYSDLSDVDLVGVADSSEDAARAVARRYGCRPYVDYLRLLDEQKPDAVTIAVPTVYHLEVACAVAKRGIHLLIEKPIAFTVEEGKQIISAAEQANVNLAIGHVERFNPAVGALKERISSGELGRVFQIDARRQGPFPARVLDVGVVIDLAVHDLDIMRYVTGAEITRVYAETEHHIHSAYEDSLSGLLRLDNGAIGTLMINWLTPTKIRELHIIGERGMFRVDYLTQDLYFYENASAATASNGGWDALRVLRGVSEGCMIRHALNKKEPLRAELEAFVATVRGEAPASVTGYDGLRALELACAIVASGHEHRTIEM